MKTKNIFLIAKFNSVTQSMNEYLSRYFHVQLCSDNLEIIKGILAISEIDLVVISLIGMDKQNVSIFTEIKHNHRVPCICLGTTSEQEPFLEFFRLPRFQALTRPASNKDLMTAICQKLRLEMDGVQDEVVDTASLRKHILLVDDSPIQLRALKAILQQNFDVTMAVSGAEAMVAIGKKTPDLIFLDYEMPVCDGKMTLEMIRNLEETKNTPVVFLTGVRDTGHIKAVVDLKPAAYLLKPTSDEAIIEIVKKILGK